VDRLTRVRSTTLIAHGALGARAPGIPLRPQLEGKEISGKTSGESRREIAKSCR